MCYVVNKQVEGEGSYDIAFIFENKWMTRAGNITH